MCKIGNIVFQKIINYGFDRDKCISNALSKKSTINNIVCHCYYDKYNVYFNLISYTIDNNNNKIYFCNLTRDCDVLLSICFPNNKNNKIFVNIWINDKIFNYGNVINNEKINFSDGGFILLNKPSPKFNLKFEFISNDEINEYVLELCAFEEPQRKILATQID